MAVAAQKATTPYHKRVVSYTSCLGVVLGYMASTRDHPDKARLDEVITRWLKRHLKRLGPDVEEILEQVDTLAEGSDMLAENIQSWAEQEQQKGEH
ncbi:hypothetical protein [Halorhodospira halochloris]|uniref:hypothetical protein n=1 Tax=Halorhodospira halochloris TaxID=1052 RepID=UPI001EE8B717|nr:hypothetical protein [Halorhodospira halochloris]MCG5549553.1 hypothetical protein [Halorhodospira halochloris]